MCVSSSKGRRPNKLSVNVAVRLSSTNGENKRRIKRFRPRSSGHWMATQSVFGSIKNDKTKPLIFWVFLFSKPENKEVIYSLTRTKLCGRFNLFWSDDYRWWDSSNEMMMMEFWSSFKWFHAVRWTGIARLTNKTTVRSPKTTVSAASYHIKNGGKKIVNNILFFHSKNARQYEMRSSFKSDRDNKRSTRHYKIKRRKMKKKNRNNNKRNNC